MRTITPSLAFQWECDRCRTRNMVPVEQPNGVLSLPQTIRALRAEWKTESFYVSCGRCGRECTLNLPKPTCDNQRLSEKGWV